MLIFPQETEVFLPSSRCEEGSENKGESKRLYFAFFLYLSMSTSCRMVSIPNRAAAVIRISPIRNG